jgi:hypothetical protein
MNEKERSNPILASITRKRKENFSLPAAFSTVGKQEVSIPSSSFFDMSFELDTYSLRDVIVIVWVREILSLVNITENKCSIVTMTMKTSRSRHAH